MRRPSARHVENDVAPERARLGQAEAQSILTECARALERGVDRVAKACPPRAPRGRIHFARNGPTLYIGLLGQAFGFLHLHERTGEERHLQLARDYLEAAGSAIARSAFPPANEWLSFHGTGGFEAIAAVASHRAGDAAASTRHVETYRALSAAAADRTYPTEDLLWGRGGFLFGAAYLRAQLGAEAIGLEQVAPAARAMLEAGRRQASAHARELTAGEHGTPPLLYLNYNASVIGWFACAVLGRRSTPGRWVAGLGGRVVSAYEDRSFDLAHRYDLSLVHGLPGNLYLLMHFPELLDAEPSWARDVRASLDCVADCLDAEQGILELLPSPRSDASQSKRGAGRFTERVHWCGGTPGMVFVFSRAYTVFGEARYLAAAERAAEHTWRNGLVCKGNGICHGIAGNGYAFLALHRATSDARALDRALHFARHSLSPRVVAAQRKPDRPWSLYEGSMGTLCFYADCLEPAKARFPAFEV